MPLTVLEKWVENGSFNPECIAEGDCICSMAILIDPIQTLRHRHRERGYQVDCPPAQGTNWTDMHHFSPY